MPEHNQTFKKSESLRMGQLNSHVTGLLSTADFGKISGKTILSPRLVVMGQPIKPLTVRGTVLLVSIRDSKITHTDTQQASSLQTVSQLNDQPFSMPLSLPYYWSSYQHMPRLSQRNREARFWCRGDGANFLE
jgi:hypothetical protein